MEFLTKYWKQILSVLLILTVVGGIWWGSNRYNHVLNDWKTSVANEKAYAARLDTLTNNNRVFQFTIDQLRYSNDSISKRLMAAIREVDVKNKNVQELQYLYSHFERTDTVLLTDTIFINNLVFDTVIGDDWMHTHLHMEYPNVVSTETCVTSKKDVVVSSSKETVNPPRKFIVFRWFQKKHTVLKVNVLEENPNITSEDNVFIRVIN